ncbi:MAG: DMT family transporter [Candidatus Riflebacteria bacterium]|nr:DMT family transporter [Candidatus Riflebacteria bacterium]
MPKEFFRGILQIVVASIIWGLAYPLTKDALQNISPIFLGFCRFFLAGVLLMAFSRSKPLEGIAPADRKTVIFMAFWGTFVLVLCMNFGLRLTPGIVSSIISGTPPLFTVILAAFWLNESLLGRHFVAFFLSIFGIFLLSDFSSSIQTSNHILLGIILITVAQIAWAIYGVLGKSISKKYPWLQICRDSFVLGAFMLAPFALIELALIGPGHWDLKGYLTLLYLGIGNSIVTYGLWNNALKMIPVSTASFVLYLQPISGALLSAILFGESITFKGFAGCILIFLALFLVLKSEN